MAKYLIRPVTKNDKKNNSKKRHRTKLNDLLVDKNIKQSVLANSAGLEPSQVSLIVQGIQTDMLLSTAKKICNSLDVSLDELWGEGVVDYKTQTLNYIEREKEKLVKNDVHGEIWLEKFERFVLTLKP